MSKMNAGRVGSSPLRLDPLLELLKKADYPLTAEEIGTEVYPEVPGKKKRYMPNVSTYIGELRSEENRALGCIVSFSSRWKTACPGEPLGKRTNGDGSITYLISKATQPWHDGRPRYFVIAARGWTPRWQITQSGEMRKYGMGEGRGTSDEEDRCEAPTVNSTIRNIKSELETAPWVCRNPACNKPLPLGESYTCNAECNKAWRVSLRPKCEAAPAQGTLI